MPHVMLSWQYAVIIAGCLVIVAEASRTPLLARTRIGWRLWGGVACFVGAHEWSDWEVQDPDHPGDQVRTCARCGIRKSSNAAPAPDAWKKFPFT